MYEHKFSVLGNTQTLYYKKNLKENNKQTKQNNQKRENQLSKKNIWKHFVKIYRAQLLPT